MLNDFQEVRNTPRKKRTDACSTELMEHLLPQATIVALNPSSLMDTMHLTSIMMHLMPSLPSPNHKLQTNPCGKTRETTCMKWLLFCAAWLQCLAISLGSCHSSRHLELLLEGVTCSYHVHHMHCMSNSPGFRPRLASDFSSNLGFKGFRPTSRICLAKDMKRHLIPTSEFPDIRP